MPIDILGADLSLGQAVVIERHLKTGALCVRTIWGPALAPDNKSHTPCDVLVDLDFQREQRRLSSSSTESVTSDNAYDSLHHPSPFPRGHIRVGSAQIVSAEPDAFGMRVRSIHFTVVNATRANDSEPQLWVHSEPVFMHGYRFVTMTSERVDIYAQWLEFAQEVQIQDNTAIIRVKQLGRPDESLEPKRRGRLSWRT